MDIYFTQEHEINSGMHIDAIDIDGKKNNYYGVKEEI